MRDLGGQAGRGFAARPGQPDRHKHANAPKQRMTLSGAAQRRCSAQTPPASPCSGVVGDGGGTWGAHAAWAEKVALPPCREAPLGGSATTLGACSIDPYQNVPTNAETQRS